MNLKFYYELKSLMGFSEKHFPGLGYGVYLLTVSV